VKTTDRSWIKAAGRARPSYTATHITGKDLTPEEERSIQWGATLLFLSGNDTVGLIHLMDDFS
jgi:hypothetical protein